VIVQTTARHGIIGVVKTVPVKQLSTTQSACALDTISDVQIVDRASFRKTYSQYRGVVMRAHPKYSSWLGPR